MDLKVSKEIEFLDVKEIKVNPNNRNLHTKRQIERLCKIIEYQGFRSPLIVSKRSGLLVSGHGRLMAAKKLGIKKLPVLIQDFDSEEQEYAAGVSENSIAAWSQIDLTNIHIDLPKLTPFDIELLGIKDFQFEPKAGEDSKGKGKEVTCPDCGLQFEV